MTWDELRYDVTRRSLVSGVRRYPDVVGADVSSQLTVLMVSVDTGTYKLHPLGLALTHLHPAATCSTLLCSTLLCSTLLCRLMWRWQENPQYSKQLSVSAIIRFFLLQEIRIFYGISDEIRGELILTRRYNSRTPKVKQYLSFVKDLPLTRIIQIWGKLSNNYLDFYKTLLVTVNLVSFHT